MKKKLEEKYTHVRRNTRAVYKTITRTILTYPLRSFFGVLGLLFLFIIIGNSIGKPKNAVKPEIAPKVVSLYGIGHAPKIRVTARVEKSGVVKIVAQSPGVVQAIYKTEGDRINRGDWLVWLSTNYQGGTIPTTSRQIAQKNYDYVKDNYDAQKNLIDTQRKLANTMQTQGVDMRQMTNDSIAGTQGLLDLDQEMLDTLNTQIDALKSANAGGANDALILQAQQGKAGVLASMNALKSGLASAQYQVNTDKTPTQLSNLQHDITIKQLDLQQKGLDLNRELSELNLRIAQISETLMYPASPVTGIVERVNVKVGQTVSPGDTIATVTSDKTVSSIIASIPSETAASLSTIEKSVIHLGSKNLMLFPRYISREHTDGNLNTVVFSIPPENEGDVAGGTNISIELPVGSVTSTASIPYIPLDSVYQTQDQSYVYVATESAQKTMVAKAKQVTLGGVYGQYVQVESGLMSGDQVINSRNVVDGDALKIE